MVKKIVQVVKGMMALRLGDLTIYYIEVFDTPFYGSNSPRVELATTDTKKK